MFQKRSPPFLRAAEMPLRSTVAWTEGPESFPQKRTGAVRENLVCWTKTWAKMFMHGHGNTAEDRRLTWHSPLGCVSTCQPRRALEARGHLVIWLFLPSTHTVRPALLETQNTGSKCPLQKLQLSWHPHHRSPLPRPCHPFPLRDGRVLCTHMCQDVKSFVICVKLILCY